MSLVACGGDGGGGGGNGGTAMVSGTSQKGPFQAGGTVTATRLADDGTTTGEQVTTSIDDRGDYGLPEQDWSGATEITVEGTFYDEVAGAFSSETRRLEAVVVADGTLEANVNLFTHLLAERVRTLMAASDAATDALDQGRSEIQALLGISAAPTELNLLEAAANPNEADGASLLLFSAAVQQAGLSQAQIDAMAADFGDDGQMNGSVDGTGQAAFQAVQEAALDDTLLDTARSNLQDEYGETAPDFGSGTGAGWKLSPCAAAKLTEPRVFCHGETFEGTQGMDGDQPILFYPGEDGYYVFALDDPAGKLSFTAGWTVYAGEDSTAPEVGDSYANDTAPFEDVTTLDLDAGDPHALQVNLAGLDQSDDAFTLVPNQVSEGAGYTPVEIQVGEPHQARVGQLFVNGTTGGPATSWYRFTAGGTHTIRVEGYGAADPSGGGLLIEVYQGASGQETVNDLNALTEIDFKNPEGNESSELTVDLDGERTTFVLITNLFTDSRRQIEDRPAPGWVDFSLYVTAQ